MAFSGDGGVEHMMCNLMQGMVELGVDVDLIRIKASGGHVARIPPEVRVIDLNRATSLLALPALVRYLRRERPGALLAAKDRAGRVAVLARRLAGVDTRVGIRLGQTLSASMQPRSRLKRATRYLPVRWLFPMADELITVSDGVAEDMAMVSGLPRSRFRTIANPTITERMRRIAAEPVAEPWLRERTAPVLVAAGRLTRQKDFPTLLRAFAELTERRDARLIILGEGRGRAHLESMIGRLGLGERVKLKGFVDNPYPYMTAADLFVLSSRWEGSPNVLVEALALGTPVVSTDCPSGPREILGPALQRALVPVGDPAAMARAMAAALDDPPRVDELRGCVGRFTVEGSARGYLEALGIALPEPARASDSAR